MTNEPELVSLIDEHTTLSVVLFFLGIIATLHVVLAILYFVRAFLELLRKHVAEIRCALLELWEESCRLGKTIRDGSGDDRSPPSKRTGRGSHRRRRARTKTATSRVARHDPR